MKDDNSSYWPSHDNCTADMFILYPPRWFLYAIWFQKLPIEDKEVNLTWISSRQSSWLNIFSSFLPLLVHTVTWPIHC
jgi:hypothetical protein